MATKKIYHIWKQTSRPGIVKVYKVRGLKNLRRFKKAARKAHKKVWSPPRYMY